VVEGSFQAFLAEETKLLADGQTAPNSTPPQTDRTVSTTPEVKDNAETVHILQHGETIWELARDRYHLDPADLLRYNNITSPGKLQAGTKIRIPGEQQQVTDASSKEVIAGWYGSYHQGKVMANGRRFNMHAATLAHRDMPIGTKVELENPKTGEKAQAVVTDRGPYHQGRDVDLSYGLAKRLSLATQGIGKLKMRVL
jgi:rare lipoprotein A